MVALIEGPCVVIDVVEGDLLGQRVDVIVNPWNRNILPWWCLVPSGVSRTIKRSAGTAPFRELARCGPLPLGHAVLTSAGRLDFLGIIHVAGIDLLWRASERSIRSSVRSAMAIVAEQQFRSVAFPIIGSGSGHFDQLCGLQVMLDELTPLAGDTRVRVVRFG